MDYMAMVQAMAAIAAIAEPTDEHQQQWSTLADMFTVSWSQEGRTMPKSQAELDALMTEAMAIVSFYNK